LFRRLGLLEDFPDPERLAAMAAGYRCGLDFEATMPSVERHGLLM
jgi:hypothetical protein